MYEAHQPLGTRVRATGQALAAVVRLTWRASPRLVAGTLVLVLLQALLPPATLIFAKAVVDRAALDLGGAGDPAGFAARLPLAAWIAATAAVVALTQLIEPFERTFQSVIGDRVTAYMSEALMQAANRWQGLARFEDPSFADDLERVRAYSRRAGLELLTFGVTAFAALFTASGLVLLLGRLHPLAPLLLLLASLPQMVQWWNFTQRTRNHLYAKTPLARRLEYSRSVLLEPEPAKDVRLYALGGFFGAQYQAAFDASMGTLSRLRTRSAFRVSLSAALGATAAGAVYLYVLWRVTRGELTAGDVLLYGGAATLLQVQFVQLSLDVSFLPLYFGTYLASLFRVLDAPPDLPLPAHPRPVPESIREGVTFEDVEFRYAGVDEPVLRGVSFTLRPGEGLALVGRNGAGKTTIVKLLLRLYDPTAGRILLDGVDLREYDLTALRARMGVIFQDFVRYELTAGENIGLGQVETLTDCDRLAEAAARGGAAQLVSSLPEGLDTPLGRELGGRELSGGEWQKLALARAFMRDCQILVLDEPTAALDVQTEYDVYTRFYDLTRNRATLLISHRFSTVRMADRILYLEGGRIAEEGSHAELIALGGAYARLYQLQAAQYLDQGAAEAAS
jgi:ATP-binding cassette subfamily B protein